MKKRINAMLQSKWFRKIRRKADDLLLATLYATFFLTGVSIVVGIIYGVLYLFQYLVLFWIGKEVSLFTMALTILGLLILLSLIGGAFSGSKK